MYKLVISGCKENLQEFDNNDFGGGLLYDFENENNPIFELLEDRYDHYYDIGKGYHGYKTYKINVLITLVNKLIKIMSFHFPLLKFSIQEEKVEIIHSIKNGQLIPKKS